MRITLKIWRQQNADAKGSFETFQLDEVTEHMSLLEMLDVLNEKLLREKKDPVAFDHDCREGICGSCSMTINSRPHGPMKGTTACQVHMRAYSDGDTLTIEPWRANAFPIVKDLVTDRSAFDRIIEAGGYISINTGQAQDGNAIPIEKGLSTMAFDSAACIGCGACVAACPNASAMLFTSAKVSHLALVPQGKVEAKKRVTAMVEQMDMEGFGLCSNTGACEAECPKEISITNIARMNRHYLGSVFTGE